MVCFLAARCVGVRPNIAAVIVPKRTASNVTAPASRVFQRSTPYQQPTSLATRAQPVVRSCERPDPGVIGDVYEDIADPDEIDFYNDMIARAEAARAAKKLDK